MDAQLELHEGSQIADRFWRLNNLVHDPDEGGA